MYPMNNYTDDSNGNYFQWPSSVYPYIKNGDQYYGSSGVYMCPDFPDPVEGSPYSCNLLLCVNGGAGQATGAHPGQTVDNVTLMPTTSNSQIGAPADTVMLLENGVNSPGVNPQAYNYFDPDENYWIPSSDTYWNGVGTPPDSYKDHVDLAGQIPANIANGTGGDCDATAGSAQDGGGPGGYGTCGQTPRYRHNNTSDFVYADGHVKSVVRGQLNWYKAIYIKGLYESYRDQNDNPYPAIN